MTYLVIFNGRRGVHKERIHNATWLGFLTELDSLVASYGEPPDLIYLEDIRK